MLSLLIVLFCLTGQWLLGLAVARLLLPVESRLEVARRGGSSAAEPIGQGIVLGIGLTAWLLFLWSFLGGRLDRAASLTVACLGFIAGIPAVNGWIKACRANRNERAATLSSSSERGGVSPPVLQATGEQRQQQSFCRVCQLVVVGLIVMATVESLLTPQRLWDERAIFAVKASVLFHDKTISSPDLAEKDFVQGHPRYPLLLPLAELHLYNLLGEIDDRLSKIYFPLLYGGLVLTTIGVLCRRISSGQAWLAGILLATVPALMPHEYGFLCGQADAPVACYHGIAVLYLWDFAERLTTGTHSSRDLIGGAVAAGLCAGLAAFTKDEGIAFLIIDVIALALFHCFWLFRSAGQLPSRGLDATTKLARSSRKQALAATTGFIVAAAVVLIPWFIHRRGLPHTTEMNYFGRMSLPLSQERLTTLGWTAPHLARRMFWEWREWGLQWWLMIIVIVLVPRRLWRGSQMLLLLNLLGALTALMLAGMLAPIQLEDHIGGSSHRFLMQIAPVVVLFAASQLARRPQPCNTP